MVGSSGPSPRKVAGTPASSAALANRAARFSGVNRPMNTKPGLSRTATGCPFTTSTGFGTTNWCELGRQEGLRHGPGERAHMKSR